MIEEIQVDYRLFPSVDYPLNGFPKNERYIGNQKIEFTFNLAHWLKHGKIVSRFELAKISSRLIKSPKLSGNWVNWLWLRSSERRSIHTKLVWIEWNIEYIL